MRLEGALLLLREGSGALVGRLPAAVFVVLLALLLLPNSIANSWTLNFQAFDEIFHLEIFVLPDVARLSYAIRLCDRLAVVALQTI